MILFFPSNNLGDPLDDLISGLEESCIAFNEFAVQFFGYLKYIFVFILLAIGISTLLKLKGTIQVYTPFTISLGPMQNIFF